MRRALALLVLAVPSLARADAFEPPPGKKAVEVVIGLENAADYPRYTFVLWPHACYNEESGDYQIIADLDDDLGREKSSDEYCTSPSLYAFPVDAYPLDNGALSPAARDQLKDGPPADPRVLQSRIDAEALWWVPDDLPLDQIRDVYRVTIADTTVKLQPTRVLFEFTGGRVLDKSFYKGRRPRIPREGDIPPAPPPGPSAPAPSDTPPATASAPTPVPSDTPPAPAPADSPTPSRPAPAPAPSAPAPAAEPARTEQPAPRIPPALLYGGGCLLVALGAGLALRRR